MAKIGENVVIMFGENANRIYLGISLVGARKTKKKLVGYFYWLRETAPKGKERKETKMRTAFGYAVLSRDT